MSAAALQKNYDVIILGSGLAGLYAAYHLCGGEAPKQVLILSKQAPEDSGSALAQGGVAAVLEQDDDSFALHIEDTLVAGNYQNDVAAVEMLVREGPGDVRRVMALGVEFDRTPEGGLSKTLEGGHSRRRIVHHADQTGKELMDKLLPLVRALPGVTLAEDAVAYAAQKLPDGFCVEVLLGAARCQSTCAFLILATGGIGQVYRHTTNPAVSTGDGIRLAYELGARIKNLSFVQFHPTAFHSPGKMQQFLISEAVRGEGAYLRNCGRERFMHRYDARLELAPRDVVSQAILQEARATGSNDFYLDITHRDADFVRRRFPGIYVACLARGVDMAVDLIPVFPCQHYLMGGVQVDLHSRTTVPGLYACGECAHTGLHGGNRLASNSLPEALVFGRKAAEDILREAPCAACKPAAEDAAVLREPARTEARRLSPPQARQRIQQEMQDACFVFPNKEKLPGAAKRMRALYARLRQAPCVTRDWAETCSLACVAALILEDAEEKLL
ncbi:MAG: FAD-binding protein [Oscillospiraceae bacterium]|jgi:L-aspartate oxidase|nr:FAD-binding protein [Oscillospiraceae bacterium]